MAGGVKVRSAQKASPNKVGRILRSNSAQPNEEPLDLRARAKSIALALLLSIGIAAVGSYFFAAAVIEPEAYRFASALRSSYSSLPEVPEFKGPYRKNEFLAKADRLLLDQVYGPESLAIHPVTGRLWTGLKTGLICEIEVNGQQSEIKRAVRLSNFTDCTGSYSSAPKCGRPLGLRFTSKGELLVVDPYLGLFLLDLEKEKVSTLFKSAAEVVNDKGRPTRYINDVDVLPDGRVIVSESSHRFDDRDFIFDLFEHRANGRLLLFSPATGEIRTLLSGLYFPNGVQVIDDYVFFAEMGLCAVKKINYKTLAVKTVVAGLPGYPDNIRLDQIGQLLVPIAALRDSTDAWLAAHPRVRLLISKILTPRALTFLAEALSTPYGLVLRVDPVTGKVVESLHDPRGSTMSAVSIAIQASDGSLLLGSDSNYYIGRLDPKSLLTK